MSQTVETQRDRYWDLLKALLIILVIWGHCIQFLEVPGSAVLSSVWDSACFKGIYLFHMPLFMAVSGYFAAASLRRRGAAALPRYACRLLVPCLTYAVLHIAVAHVFHMHLRSVWEELFTLWFLVVVFECTCLYYLARRCRCLLGKVAWLLLPPLVVTVCEAFCPSVIPAASHFSFLWPFFLVAAWANEGGLTSQSVSRLWVVGLLPLIPCAIMVPQELFVYITPLSLSSSSWLPALGRTAAAAVFCIGFLGLGKCISGIAGLPLVVRMARATLALYVLHVFFFGGIRILLPHGISHLPSFVTLAAAVGCTLLLLGCSIVLRRIPVLPFLLFGERR